MRYKVLITDPISDSGISILKNAPGNTILLQLFFYALWQGNNGSN